MPRAHRTRPKRPKAKLERVYNSPKPFPFLELPGEIRNKIYTLIFGAHVIIRRSHPGKRRQPSQPQGEPSGNARVQLTSLRLREYPSLPSLPTQAGFLRICRRIRREVVELFFERVTFRFDSVITVNKFLNVAPPEGVKAIKSLELRHSTYGEPYLMKDRVWKIRHDKKWGNTCKRIADQMAGLTKLRIELTINDWPAQLNLKDEWAKSLLYLKGKDHVEVILASLGFSEERLRAAARVIQNALTKTEARERIENTEALARIERLKANGGQEPAQGCVIPKAAKLLTIKLTAAQVKEAAKGRGIPTKCSAHRHVA